MKVLHVIPSVSPRLGGPSQVAIHLVRALCDAGVDAEIATTNDDGADLMDVPLYERTEYRQVPVWFFPRLLRLKEFIVSVAFHNWLTQQITNYDILDNHYLFSYTPACAAAIARRQNIPYTVRTMGQLSPWALAQSQLKKQIYTTLIERRNLNHAAAIHCTSRAEAEDVLRFGAIAPTVTLPLGVNPSSVIHNAKAELHQRYGIPPNLPIVLFLSRLHHKKRPELLLQSLSSLLALGKRFHLIVAGAGDPCYLDDLERLVASLGMTHCVSFVGFVEGRNKDLLLQGSDLFVLPSFSENFGIAVAEALAAGLPVVITPEIQIASEVAEAEAGFVVQGTVTQLAMAIAQLLDSPNLRWRMGVNGRRLAQERYCWQSIAQNLVSVYQRIVIEKTLSNPMKFTHSI